jgi:ParB family chromosome partitioning protein
LPEEILQALSEGKINEGHTRPLLMLIDRPEEQKVLFQDIILRKMNVRDAEQAARQIAIERVRKINSVLSPDLAEMEEKFMESLRTRVKIEKRDRDRGGKLLIEFFSDEDLMLLLNMITRNRGVGTTDANQGEAVIGEGVDDRTGEEIKQAEDRPIEDDLYSIKNFSI